MISKWVLIDESNNAQTGDGDVLTPGKLALIAKACETQLNEHFSNWYGGFSQVRAAVNPQDVKPDEKVYSFVRSFVDIPNDSAYHDILPNGTAVAYCAVSTCSSILGANGICQDASHELLEAEGNPACNLFADGYSGRLFAREVCDPVEVQSYTIEVNGIACSVSNFVLPSWFNPKGIAPYDCMSYYQEKEAVPPTGPFQIAPSSNGRGNYEITEINSGESQVFGNPRKNIQHNYSRIARIRRRKR